MPMRLFFRVSAGQKQKLFIRGGDRFMFETLVKHLFLVCKQKDIKTYVTH